MSAGDAGLDPTPQGPPPRAHNPPGASKADIMRRWPVERRDRWLAGLSAEELVALEHDWSFWARAKQLPPDERFLVWLVLAGRGFGKTRTGAEWTIRAIEKGGIGGNRFSLVGRTIEDAVGIMVEGESGILAHSPPWFRPVWKSASCELHWPNGVVGLVFGAHQPDAFRGYQHGGFWADEICAWQHWSCLNHLLLGLRLGRAPQGIITTTPRPLPALRDLMAKPTTVNTSGYTYDNLANLSPTFATEILSQYEGTRLGRQELYAEILDDSPTALWKRAMMDACRVTTHPRLLRIVVGVDPAGTNSAKSNHTGIVVAGLGIDKIYYVLEDATMSDKPTEWAKKAAFLYHRHHADRVVAETNMGGDMVETIIRVVDPTVAYKGVVASRGKITRAEPIAALYEQERVKHVGFFPQLEDEMCTYDPMALDGLRSDSTSPDRLDALVWAITELHNGRQPVLRMNIAGASPTRRSP